jgi:hypothetical protein
LLSQQHALWVSGLSSSGNKFESEGGQLPIVCCALFKSGVTVADLSSTEENLEGNMLVIDSASGNVLF